MAFEFSVARGPSRLTAGHTAFRRQAANDWALWIPGTERGQSVVVIREQIRLLSRSVKGMLATLIRHALAAFLMQLRYESDTGRATIRDPSQHNFEALNSSLR